LRTCSTCKTDKEVDDFYARPGVGDGIYNVCKECMKGNARRRYEKQCEAVFMGEDPPVRNKPSPEALQIKYKKRYANNKHKFAANGAVNRAIKAGELVRGPCEKCADPDTEGHHDDYNKPLDVRWLCKTHHNEHHRKQRALERQLRKEVEEYGF
jgi:hypothetical protein